MCCANFSSKATRGFYDNHLSKTNRPNNSIFAFKFCMFCVRSISMDEQLLIVTLILAYIKRQRCFENGKRKILMHLVNFRKRRKYCASALLQMLNEYDVLQSQIPRMRTCCPLLGNKGCWNTVTQYDDKRFKKQFRMRITHFSILVEKLHSLEREFVSGNLLSVDERSAITLFKLG